MKIKKATASYGKLKGDTLELQPGLNIIQAPNESGKSTWCSFIRNMLYGLNTAERDKAGFMSDKTKYRPWHGGEMEGTIDLTYEDQELTISRTALGRAAMRDFSAVYTGTEIPVNGLNTENAGAVLTGVTRPVFERSAFIRQSGLPVAQTGELEKRIVSIVSSGEESVSYTEADSKLRALLRKRRFNNTGTIPALQAKIRENEEITSRLKNDCAESGRLRRQIDDLQKEKELLSRESEAHEVLDRLAERESIDNAKKAYDEAGAKLVQAKLALGKFGDTSDEFLNEIRGDASAITSVKEMADTACDALTDAKKERDNAVALRDASPFSKFSYDDADEIADSAEHLEQAISKKKKLNTALSVLFLVLAAVCIAAGFFIFKPLNLAFWAAAAVLVIITAVLFIAASSSRKKLKDMLSAHNMENPAQLRVAVQNYKALCDDVSKSEEKYSAALSSYNNAANILEDRMEKLLEKALKAHKGIKDVAHIGQGLEEIENAKSEYQRCQSRSEIAKKLYDALSENADDTPIPMPDLTPRYTKARTEAAYREASSKLETAQAGYNMTLGRMRALGDPLVLEGENRLLSEKLREQSAQYDAINLAIEALSEADTEIQTRFAPVLTKSAGSYFHRLTGGKYDMLAFDRTLDAAAQAHGDSVSRNILSLSEGTANQVYLALRLAISTLALEGSDPCPIILDDALASFDDVRMGYALECLKELANERQVILFTCHSREAEYFAGDTSVNVVNL